MLTSLLISVPGEVFCGVTTGQGKEGEKVLLAGGCCRRGDAWLLLLQLPPSSHISCEVS